MLKKFMRVILGVFGAIMGYQLVYMLDLAEEFNISAGNLDSFFTTPQFIGIMIGALVGLFILFFILEKVLEFIINFEYRLKELTWEKIIVAFLGLITGLIFGVLINLSFSIRDIPRVGLPISIFLNIICTYFGFTLAINKQDDFLDFVLKRNKDDFTYGKMNNIISNKILDTSVIIDGRILDICQTGFVEGTLIIPEFVLEELRHIADSSDVLKRNRGRRGLDILKQMQQEEEIDVRIVNQDFDDIQEVDSKLVKLAQIINSRILTNDYNLNKVADLQGVFVLNINELANAVKPVVLPGEEMDVKVIKEGKEDGQGVGYLDDGTMIVVDEGIKYIGKEIDVLVTSILQTAAGRMIFAKPNIQEKAL